MIVPKDLEYLYDYEDLFGGRFWGVEPSGELVYSVAGKDYSLAKLSEDDVEILIERAKQVGMDVLAEQLPLFTMDQESVY